MQILFPSFGLEVVDVLNLNGIRHVIDGNAICFPAQQLKMQLIPLSAEVSVGAYSSAMEGTVEGPDMRSVVEVASAMEGIAEGSDMRSVVEVASAMEGTAEGPDMRSGVEVASAMEGTVEGASGMEVFWLYEDRWKSSRTVTSQRMLARLGVFRRIHARLCHVVSESNCKEFGLSPEAFRLKVKRFLEAFHTYGFLKGQTSYLLMHGQDMVAAAQFMHTYDIAAEGNERRAAEGFGCRADEEKGCRAAEGNGCRTDEEKGCRAAEDNGRASEGEGCVDVESEGRRGSAWEWTRYASLPDVRIAGGMGKVFRHFLSHTGGVSEVMSYSDNEWGNGEVYSRLGFRPAGCLPPVDYHIDPVTFKRINPRQWEVLTTKITPKESERYIKTQNRGSRKWIFKV